MSKASTRKVVLFLIDSAACAAAFYFGAMLWQEGNGMDWTFAATYALLFVGIQMLVFTLGGMYTILWRQADAEEALWTLMLGMIGGMILLTVNALFRIGFSPSMLFIVSILAVMELSGMRFVWRALNRRHIRFRPAASFSPGAASPSSGAVMVVGAGEAGTYVVGRLLSDVTYRHQKIVLVDDDPSKQAQRVRGVPILGTSKQIPELSKMHNVGEIFIAIPSLGGKRFADLAELCGRAKCRVHVLRDSPKLGKGPGGELFRELDGADFLCREEVRLESPAGLSFLCGKRVLVTGGGGSIGSELCRQIVNDSPELLIIFDIYENNAYQLQMELLHIIKTQCPVLVMIGSVQDKARLEEIFAAYKPEIIFHAAAYKHVPLMETSPAEAVKNNVFGTKTLLEAAARHEAERFVLLSTDKAVNPANAMGATKRITEMLVQLYAKQTRMKCMAVRFGNVLGSHGSVIPLFEAQIKAGGPVTVTDPETSRYFMTIAEAAQLVLEAGGMAQSGVIYVLDMGEPVFIKDLAERLIRFYGYEPGKDMEIVYTGLRGGEKLHEELFEEKEQVAPQRTGNPKILSTLPRELDEALFQEQLQRLRKIAFEAGLEESLYEAMKEIVGNFQYKKIQKRAV